MSIIKTSQFLWENIKMSYMSIKEQLNFVWEDLNTLYMYITKIIMCRKTKAIYMFLKAF